tara:strand:- start:741 stop:1280 length:540 start_codon:yes stop_codon:yes gene_type:complete
MPDINIMDALRKLDGQGSSQPGLTSFQLRFGLSLLVGGTQAGKTQTLANLLSEIVAAGRTAGIAQGAIPGDDRFSGGIPFYALSSLIHDLRTVPQGGIRDGVHVVLIDDFDEMVVSSLVGSPKCEEEGATSREACDVAGMLDRMGKDKNIAILASWTPTIFGDLPQDFRYAGYPIYELG